VAASSWREPARPIEVKAPPREARCAMCGEWIMTVPAATTWARGRCGNRRCPKYGEGQTVHLRNE
jgi:hypothetical protein